MVMWVKNAMLADDRGRALLGELEAALAAKAPPKALASGKRKIDKKASDLRARSKASSVRIVLD